MEKTEMMKRYEAEAGECATWTWHERKFLTDDYIAWLEAQLRWRPVSEKPKESDRYIVKYRQGKVVKKFIADYDVVYGWNIPLPDVEILGYLPIPPAPEGEKAT